jgi:diaminohydroxyphosphoribosylaminopyrimidine deaminase/5-amino-6-(5-phosphoribosylamino)uracil reductase
MTGSSDNAYMAQALRLAERGLYTAMPNPIVGCVIVNDGVVVGEGWHQVAGENHAEVNALQAAGDRARGATAYVTLEPCAHHGKTPPCAAALVAAGVAEVVIGLRDPHPEVDGRGIRILEAAGISVRSGVLADAVQRQLEGFLSRVTRGRPLVRLKTACSLDGRTAMASGESRWITGPAARADVQRLRARAGAILTGIGTVLADDPSLTVRDPAIDTGGRQPLRVVLDDHLRMPPSAKMLTLAGETLIYCSSDANHKALVAAGAGVVQVGASNGHVDASAVLDDLGARGVNEVLVEAGPILGGSLITANLVDELVIYQAPHIMGSETRGMFRTPAWTALSDRRPLAIIDTHPVGPDTRITARFAD